MPASYYRLEVRLDRELRNRIEQLRKEMTKETGEFISTSKLVSTILSSCLERISPKIEEKVQ